MKVLCNKGAEHDVCDKCPRALANVGAQYQPNADYGTTYTTGDTDTVTLCTKCRAEHERLLAEWVKS